MKREIWIEKLRVFAAMGVIVLHVVRGTYVNEPANIPQYRRLFDLDFLLGTFDWAVPVFIMISGYLLLDSQKDLTNGKLIKYIKKMVYILCTFGLSYCLIESFVNYKNQGAGKIISDAILNLLTGNCWGHMWYVYMLIGLYAVTPVIKTFVNNASDKVLIQILILFWIMTINGFGFINVLSDFWICIFYVFFIIIPSCHSCYSLLESQSSRSAFANSILNIDRSFQN